MRAITVRQPWAWAIIHGGKDIENRTRNLAGVYRGPVAVHAGLAPDTAAQGHWPLGDLIPMEAWRIRGAIIGATDLVDVHHADWCWEPEGHCSRWGQELSYHLALASPRPLEVPIPARGMLGLWTPAADVLEQLQAVADA